MPWEDGRGGKRRKDRNICQPQYECNKKPVPDCVVYGRWESKRKAPVEDAIALYGRKNERSLKKVQYPIKKGEVILHGFTLIQGGADVSDIDGSYPVEVSIDFEVVTDLTFFRMGIFILSYYEDIITRSLLADWDPQFENIKKGRYTLHGVIPSSFLAAGDFVFQVHVSRYGIIDYRFGNETSQLITVHAPKDFNTVHPSEGAFGKILLNAHWSVRTKDID